MVASKNLRIKFDNNLQRVIPQKNSIDKIVVLLLWRFSAPCYMLHDEKVGQWSDVVSVAVKG